MVAYLLLLISARDALARRGNSDLRKQHADAPPVLPIAVAEVRDKVALFEPNADKDVASSCDGKEQVAQRHVRRRPKSQNEAGVDRMAQPPIQRGRYERWLRRRAPKQPGESLAQAEQVKVTDEECAQEQHPPSYPRHDEERPRADGVIDGPDRLQ